MGILVNTCEDVKALAIAAEVLLDSARQDTSDEIKKKLEEAATAMIGKIRRSVST